MANVCTGSDVVWEQFKTENDKPNKNCIVRSIAEGWPLLILRFLTRVRSLYEVCTDDKGLNSGV